EMLVKAQDVWPNMQGSVLVVTDDYLKNNPEEVKNLYKVTEQASQYINEHPKEAAEKVANRLNMFEDSLDINLEKIANGGDDFTVKNSLIEKSMSNLEYSTSLDEEMVQEIIDYVYKLGYIKKSFPAEDIMLDKSFLD
ncbi:MAG: ABC transporter substrate-binding protein, partial [Eubacteriales bacterium]